MITPEHRQKSRSAEMAHMNDLLDEALNEQAAVHSRVTLRFIP
jgi:hypothetical protein